MSLNDLKSEIQKSDIIFVADMFADQYPGGAELTTEALINTSGNQSVCKINSSNITMDLLGSGVAQVLDLYKFCRS